MSLYSVVIAINPIAGDLLASICLEPASVPRPRDVWINRELTEVTVFTRTGGGNREEYAAENAALRAHPGYLRDYDWATDPTYAEWVFVVPGAEREAMRVGMADLSDDERAHVVSVVNADATAKWTRVMGGRIRREADYGFDFS